MDNQDIRWIQRFQNFERAFILLSEIIESSDDICKLESIVKEGIVQRFEYTFELAWKTLKDKMQEDGVIFERISPKYVYKKAYQYKYLENIDVWLQMTNDRNLMSHTYDLSKFDIVLKKLQDEYFLYLKELYLFFKKEVREE